MPRTTLDLDPSVLRELRHRSAIEGRSVSRVASDLLARAISESILPQSADFTWTSADLGKPLIDLENPAAVRDVLDR